MKEYFLVDPEHVQDGCVLRRFLTIHDSAALLYRNDSHARRTGTAGFDIRRY